jgi:predicted lactoylglutathione lyase
MKPKINFITLAVTDLNKSIDFYKNGFSFPSKGIRDGNEDHCMFDLDDKFSLVLYRRQDFLPLTANPNQTEKSSGFILSHTAQSKEEVNEILKSAMKFGGTQIGQTKDEPYGYSVNVTDPDGHQWEIICMTYSDNS